jgi:hypothetical protein
MRAGVGGELPEGSTNAVFAKYTFGARRMQRDLRIGVEAPI